MEIHGVFSYPGILGPISATYTCSHGITPGVVHLTFQEQATLPASRGDVTLSDGVNTIIIRDCKLERASTDFGGTGGARCVTATLSDRRWKWELGVLNGCYNQLDTNNKLIGRTIRSPQELAEYALEQMLEGRYTLNMPFGLTQQQGQQADNFLRAGFNWPPTGTNPAINWVNENPAKALAALAELFGRRIVYDPIDDWVYVMPVGIGRSLPPGSINRSSPSITSFTVPDALMVVGGPTRFQMRVPLIAVGEEHDGALVPINQLSYTPRIPDRVQITDLTFGPTTDDTWPLTNDFDDPAIWTVRVRDQRVQYASAVGETAEDVVIEIANLLDARVGVTAVNNGLVRPDQMIRVEIRGAPGLEKTIRLTGASFGMVFEVFASVEGGIQYVQQTLVRQASVGVRSWQESMPYEFFDVEAVPGKLTYEQARELAKRSVFRYWQIDDQGADGSTNITVPGYGIIDSKWQLVPQPCQCEVVEPEWPDPTIGIDVPGDPNLGGLIQFMRNFYRGYAKDKPAALYGSVSVENQDVTFLNCDMNTEADRLLPIKFDIDPDNLLVKTDRPLYRYEGGYFSAKTVPAKLTLETGFLVREKKTNQFACFTLTRPIGTPANSLRDGVKIIHRPDIVLSVVGHYDWIVPGTNQTFFQRFLMDGQRDYEYFLSKLTSAEILEQYPIAKANYYLNAAMLEFQIKGAQTNDYNGLVPIHLDGATWQVTWRVGGGGRASTVASQNCEHATWVPQYPARRRAENLTGPIPEALRPRAPSGRPAQPAAPNGSQFQPDE